MTTDTRKLAERAGFTPSEAFMAEGSLDEFARLVREECAEAVEGIGTDAECCYYWDGQRDMQLAAVNAIRALLTDGVTTAPRFTGIAPCNICGYNGPGFFQPDTHPCAKEPKP